MTTTNAQPSAAKRLRLAAAGTLLTVAATMTVGALCPGRDGSRRHHDTPPPPGRPGGPPGGSGGPGGRLPNGPGPYVAIAFSPDNGSHGWANNAYNYQQAVDTAVANCTQFGGDQCQLAAWDDTGCAAIAVMAPTTTPDGKWGHWAGGAHRPSTRPRTQPSTPTPVVKSCCPAAQPVERVKAHDHHSA